MAISQTTYEECNISTVKSQNQKFFLRSIPFDNIENTSTGKTTVYDSDSNKVYEMPLHFEYSKNRKEIFLSNDGKIIAYVIDRKFTWNGVQIKSIQIYKNGIAVKQYQLTDLIDCDSDKEDCYLFYNDATDSTKWQNGKRKIFFKENTTNFQKKITEKATYLNNDSLFIFTKYAKLLTIDLNSNKISKTQLSDVDTSVFKQMKPISTIVSCFERPSAYALPNLSRGLTFEKGIAENLGMALFPEEKKRSFKFKSYSVSIEIIVDKNGNAILDKIKNYTSLSNDKIKNFIETQKFDTSSIPIETEKWRYTGYFNLMNKKKKQAKIEKKQEIIEQREAYKKRIIADSINGLYIPKNLEECFLELNKLLKTKDIETIKKLEDRDKTILYHHGFGTWLRNNWGLWNGSRLQIYFIKKGITHPDGMSVTILKYYYDWLNGQHENWKAFELK